MKQIFWEKIFNNFKNHFQIKENYSEVEEKLLEKTYKYIKFIKWIPGIKMIWIWNSLAMKTATKNSDIDIFIVTKENSMWFCRILITFIFQILGVRKTEKNHASRFCLSFFATEKAMNFWDFKIENDIYLYFWIVYFKPIFVVWETYKNFLEENKTWANFEDYENILEENKNFIKYQKEEKNCKFWNLILWFFDKILKKIFLRKTLKHFEKIWKPYGVIINDNLLKFHNDDIRKEISEKLKIF